MKRLFLVALAVLMPFFFTGCGFINSGEVGVRTQFGQIQPTVEQPGFYTAILSHLTIYTAKETTVDIGGLTPRGEGQSNAQGLGRDDLLPSQSGRAAQFPGEPRRAVCGALGRGLRGVRATS